MLLLLGTNVFEYGFILSLANRSVSSEASGARVFDSAFGIICCGWNGWVGCIQIINCLIQIILPLFWADFKLIFLSSTNEISLTKLGKSQCWV